MAPEDRNVAPTSEAISRPELFGPPPVLEQAEAIIYEEAFAQICREVCADVIGKMLVEDAVYKSLEVARLRRLRACSVADAAREELASFLSRYVRGSNRDNIGCGDEIGKEDPADTVARKWMVGNPAAIARVNKIMGYRRLTNEDLQAHALGCHLEQFERIDQMIANLERQRNAALRELERHNFAMAQRLRARQDGVDDAVYETIEAPRLRAADQGGGGAA